MLVLVLALVIQDPAAEVAAELTTHATPRPLSAEAVTEESPGFLGAHRRPFTDERPLLKKWPEQGPKLLWERRTGGGYAAPAIVKGRLILFHRLAGQEIVDCLDPKTGKRLWRQAAQIIYEDAFGYSNGPRCAPLIDRGQVFTYGVDGRLQCLKLEDGKVLWKRELRKDFESPQMFFGVGTTPLLVGEPARRCGRQASNGMRVMRRRSSQPWKGNLVSWCSAVARAAHRSVDSASSARQESCCGSSPGAARSITR